MPAAICRDLQVSICRCRVPLLLHLYLDAFMICHDAVGQSQRHNLVIPDLPHPTLRIPFSAYTFDLVPQGDFGHCHTYRHEAVCLPLTGIGVPVVLFDNQFYSLEPFFVLFVVSVAYTYQTTPILCKQLFGSTLVRMQRQPNTHSQAPILKTQVTADPRGWSRPYPHN